MLNIKLSNQHLSLAGVCASPKWDVYFYKGIGRGSRVKCPVKEVGPPLPER